MTTWITSDLHFGHENIRKFCPETRGQFRDAHEMNRAIIKEWQDKVSPHDTIIDLGDMFFCNATEVRTILNQLPGHKIHVYGNHDQVIRNNVDIQKMYSGGCHEYFEVTESGQHYCLFHYPIMEWNRMHRGSIHAYGHLHQRHAEVPGKIMSACWDMHGRILQLSELITLTKNMPVRTHHD